MNVDRAGSTVARVTPHPRQKLLSRERLSRMRREEFEELKLLVREVEPLAAKRRLIAFEIDLEVTKAEHVLTIVLVT